MPLASVWSLCLSLLLPSLLLLLRRRRRLSRWRLRQKALEDHEKQAKNFLKTPTYLANIGMDATNKRQEAMESVDRWGFIRAGLRRPDLHGMGAYETKVLDFLEHAGGASSSSLLGISGKHGMGKSTLLNIVHDNYSAYRPFEYIVYLELKYGCTVAMFHDVLASTLGVGSRRNQMSPALLAKTISRRLKDKTFLLMLDDVPEDGIDLAAIGLPMPLSHRQKVVFTARDQATCAKMGCAAVNKIEMQRLGEDDAWELFRYIVGDEAINLNADIAEKMVAECRGIPKALCTVGRSMSDQIDSCQWIVGYDMLTIKPLPDEIIDEGYPRLRYFEDELGDPLLCSRPSSH